MRSVATILTPSSGPELVTLELVKLEFGITDDSQDDFLNELIKQSSQIAATYCDLVLTAQTVSETFRHSLGPRGDYFNPRFCHGLSGQAEEALNLVCAPISSITSVTVDGAVLDASQYEWADEQLFRLNSSGYPIPWTFSKAIVVVYVSGYTVGVNVPADLQAAVIAILRDYRSSSLREDPNLKRRRTESVSELEWYVPTASKTVLPATITGLLDPYRAQWKWMR